MKMDRAQFEKYQTILTDKYRPPSKGGNTRAWHQHRITISGEVYSFLALGAQKWAFKGDTITFEWKWDESGRYRNILNETIVALNKHGEVVVRGNRGTKRWRTADARMPGSRREQRD